jgi:hypothetical protein
MNVTMQPAGKLEKFVALAAMDHESTPGEIVHILAEHYI